MINALLLAALTTIEPLWPNLEKMPDYQPQQYVTQAQDTNSTDYVKIDHRMPYLQWCDAPAADKRNGVCVLFISGGGYNCQCDGPAMTPMAKRMTELGCQCVFLWHQVPRPQGLAIHQSAWEDGQRAVRLVRAAAKERGFNPEKIAVVGCSAGSHLSVLLATSARTNAYYPGLDAVDKISCHINWAIPFCPAYVLTDGIGDPNVNGGEGAKLDSCFKFDDKTAPMCLIHGGSDGYSPLGSTQIYRQLRRMKVPAELHLDAGRGHGIPKDDPMARPIEFLTQMGAFGQVAGERALDHRFFPDYTRATEREALWPEGKMPDPFPNQKYEPYLVWFHPVKLTTKAIQVILPGGGYMMSNFNGEGTPLAHYLNSKGMTAVVVQYRCPRPPADKPKHYSARQDAQRAIRMVRSEAQRRGLDSDRIGVAGFSAGGNLTLISALNSETRAYGAIDAIDRVSCRVNWAVPFYPAYVLTDGLDRPNVTGGNDDSAVIGDFLDFDAGTPEMCFLHGDKDSWAAMNSVKL